MLPKGSSVLCDYDYDYGIGALGLVSCLSHTVTVRSIVRFFLIFFLWFIGG